MAYFTSKPSKKQFQQLLNYIQQLIQPIQQLLYTIHQLLHTYNSLYTYTTTIKIKTHRAAHKTNTFFIERNIEKYIQQLQNTFNGS